MRPRPRAPAPPDRPARPRVQRAEADFDRGSFSWGQGRAAQDAVAASGPAAPAIAPTAEAGAVSAPGAREEREADRAADSIREGTGGEPSPALSTLESHAGPGDAPSEDNATPLARLGNPVASALAAAAGARSGGDTPQARPGRSRQRTSTRAAPAAEDRFAALREALPGLGGDLADFAASVYEWSGRLWAQLHVRGPMLLPQPLEPYLAYRASLSAQVPILRTLQEQPSLEAARRWIVSVQNALFAARHVIAMRVAQPGTFVTTDVLVGELDRLQARGRALATRLPEPEQPAPMPEPAQVDRTAEEAAVRDREDRAEAARILRRVGPLGLWTEAQARSVATEVLAWLPHRPGVLDAVLTSASYTLADDDVARAVLNQMTDSELGAVAGSPDGRRALMRAYQALRSGFMGEEDDAASGRITAVVAGQPPAAGERPVLAVPVRRSGVTTGSGAQLWATLTPEGRIRIQYPVYARSEPGADRLPVALFTAGYDVEPDDVVAVVDYDENRNRLVRAIELLDVSREMRENTLGNIGETIAIALLPFALAGSAAAGAGRVAVWIARLGAAADIFGTLTTAIDERRGLIIRVWGEGGRSFVEIVQLIDLVLSGLQLLAGGGQVAVATLGPQVERHVGRLSRALGGLGEPSDVAALRRAEGIADDATHEVARAVRADDSATVDAALTHLDEALADASRIAESIDLVELLRYLGVDQPSLARDALARGRRFLAELRARWGAPVPELRPAAVTPGGAIADLPEAGHIVHAALDASHAEVLRSARSAGASTRQTPARLATLQDAIGELDSTSRRRVRNALRRSVQGRSGRAFDAFVQQVTSLMGQGRRDPALAAALSHVVERASRMSSPKDGARLLRRVQVTLTNHPDHAARLAGFLETVGHPQFAARPLTYLDDLDWLLGHGLSGHAVGQLSRQAATVDRQTGMLGFDLRWFRASGLSEALSGLNDLARGHPGGMLDLLARNPDTKWRHIQRIAQQYAADPSSLTNTRIIGLHRSLRGAAGEALTHAQIESLAPGHSVRSLQAELPMSGPQPAAGTQPRSGDRTVLDLELRSSIGRGYLEVKALTPPTAQSLIRDLGSVRRSPPPSWDQVPTNSTAWRLLRQITAARRASRTPVRVAVPDSIGSERIRLLEQRLRLIFPGRPPVELVLISGRELDRITHAIRSALGLPAASR